jgi:3'-5' exoribonuclease
MTPAHYLEHKAQVILPRALRDTLSFVLGNPRFHLAPASSDDPNSGHKHHAYSGGLVVHTAEVLERALLMADFYRNPNEHQKYDVLIAAAIWHDFAKIHEYTFLEGNGPFAPANIRKEPYKKLIAHVAGSYAEFLNAAKATNLAQEDPDLTDRVGHCILAHHGRKEWGSPVEPQTEEAFILHSADMWSSNFGPGKERKL